MRSVAWVVAPVCLIATIASAEIFKCVGKDGIVVYQNFRCEIDSLGSLPSDPTTASVIASSNESAKTPAEPHVGMSAKEVRAIWGDPTDTFSEEPGAGGRVEVWAYGSDRSVRFDHRSRVIAVEKHGGS